MNNDRRKAIDAVSAVINDLRNAVEAARDTVEGIRDEEQEYYDNMPESFQNGEKGEKAQAAIDALQEAYELLDGFDFDGVDSQLSTAKEG